MLIQYDSLRIQLPQPKVDKSYCYPTDSDIQQNTDEKFIDLFVRNGIPIWKHLVTETFVLYVDYKSLRCCFHT
jgi:hypothetical protein